MTKMMTKYQIPSFALSRIWKLNTQVSYLISDYITWNRNNSSKTIPSCTRIDLIRKCFRQLLRGQMAWIFGVVIIALVSKVRLCIYFAQRLLPCTRLNAIARIRFWLPSIAQNRCIFKSTTNNSMLFYHYTKYSGPCFFSNIKYIYFISD